MEDLWREHAYDWDLETRTLLEHALRPSTLKSYDSVLVRFKSFCEKCNYPYFPTTTAAVAHFLNYISQHVERPGPILISASAAIAGMYKGSNHADPTKNQLLAMLKQAIINTGTKRPRKNTPTFPVEKLTNYIVTLGDNNIMNIKDLRAKAISLLALVGLFRPSDLALLTQGQITFTDTSLSLANFGGKTDKNKEGIPTTITAATSPALCPVRTLRAYINKTADIRAKIDGSPIFIYLDKSVKSRSDGVAALSAERVAKIMTMTLVAAGIEETTARSFRKTGASTAINKGVDPDLVMKLGRWKSPEVFFKHYVDWEQSSLTDAILE